MEDSNFLVESFRIHLNAEIDSSNTKYPLVKSLVRVFGNLEIELELNRSAVY